jgi:hypothetical protein
MNSNNTHALIRSLIIYAVCIPLSVWLGFMLADPFDRSTFNYFGIMALLLCAPILLRWHHFLLVCMWNFTVTLFFLPGNPPIWLLMTALSLGISVLHRTVNNKARFLSAPAVAWPLIFLTAVVLGTSKLTGGIGLHSLGNEMAGGKSYVLLLMAILGYFALTAQQIPRKRAGLYVTLFFLAGCSSAIGDLATLMPYQSSFIFALFPPSGTGINAASGPSITETTRFGGLGATGLFGFLFMLARYGSRGIFLSGRLWRPVVFGLFTILIFFGGFRTFIILSGSIFLFQCYLERLHQTKVFPAFIFAGVIAAVLIVSFADKLPYTFQRSLAFLPLNIRANAREDAQGSQDWRLQIWKDALSIVPQYLLLGRGYAISEGQLDIASSDAFRYASNFEGVEISGNFHSGPLSVVIPFGIWGVIGILWFWVASIRALYLNFRHGDLELRTVNAFLLAYFTVEVFLFLIIFGGLYSDMCKFTSTIGLSISLNGGIRRPATAPVQTANKTTGVIPFARPRFQPFMPR